MTKRQTVARPLKQRLPALKKQVRPVAYTPKEYVGRGSRIADAKYARTLQRLQELHVD
ncbi:hypothetical protein [Bradyrhizobium guangdongense]